MAFHVRDRETDRLVRELARLRGSGLTEAVKVAVSQALEREQEAIPLDERLRAIVEPLRGYPKTGRKADKTFFDALSGD